ERRDQPIDGGTVRIVRDAVGDVGRRREAVARRAQGDLRQRRARALRGDDLLERGARFRERGCDGGIRRRAWSPRGRRFLVLAAGEQLHPLVEVLATGGGDAL